MMTLERTGTEQSKTKLTTKIYNSSFMSLNTGSVQISAIKLSVI